MTIKECITEVFSRVTGFWRPVQDYNKGKVAEFKARKHYKVKEYIDGKDGQVKDSNGRDNG